MNVKKSDIYLLLLKYLKGNIKEQENREIHNVLRSTSNEELEEVLDILWQDYEPDIMFEVETNQLFKRIQRNIHYRQAKKIFFSISRKAAVVLFPLLILGCGYLIYDRQTTQKTLHPLSVQVDAGQMADVVLPDETKVVLNSETRIAYDTDKKDTKRMVKLEGEAYFEVSSNPKKPFIVSTSHLDIEVLGTIFNVSTYESEEVLETSLLEGSIKITTTQLNENKVIYVKPHQKALYNKKTGSLQIVEANNYIETAWTKGMLVFHSEPFESIIHQLERRYNVSINLDYPNIKGDKFTGIFDNQQLNQVLDNLQLHYGFKYTIKDKSVAIFRDKTE